MEDHRSVRSTHRVKRPFRSLSAFSTFFWSFKAVGKPRLFHENDSNAKIFKKHFLEFSFNLVFKIMLHTSKKLFISFETRSKTNTKILLIQNMDQC